MVKDELPERNRMTPKTRDQKSWREAIVALLKQHRRWFGDETFDQSVADYGHAYWLEDLMHTVGSAAAAPAEARLRQLASIADQLISCGLAIADALHADERRDVAMGRDCGDGVAIPADTVAVIHAWADGAQVQSRYRGADDQWRDMAAPGERCIPNWYHSMMEFRVKPEADGTAT